MVDSAKEKFYNVVALEVWECKCPKGVMLVLTDRQKLILKAIIEEYVTTNEPVGSKVLTEKPYLTYSSATIRYEMQHLEETGYLKKTHTSSGRIPSEMGYRYYVYVVQLLHVPQVSADRRDNRNPDTCRD